MNVKVEKFFSKINKDEESLHIDIHNEVSRVTLGQVYDSSDSDTDIGSEYSTDLIRANKGEMPCSEEAMGEKIDCSIRDGNDVHKKEEKCKRKVLEGETETKSKNKFSDSQEAITCTLLKHYRPLTVFGIKFTWLGIHKLYRVVLVACNTYITDPLNKLCLMSVVLAAVSIANTVTKPYKDRNTNIVAIMSYMANICIAVINLMKVMLVTYGCQVNCGSHKKIVLWYLGKVENVLLIYLPAVLIPAALLHVGLQKCRGKSKEE